MYTLRNFRIEELVDEKTYAEFGKQSQKFFYGTILETLDELRDLLDRPLIVNNWKEGGQYEWSGLRTVSYLGGSKYSGHRFGMAMDVKCPSMSAPLVQSFIRIQKGLGKLKGITRMEKNTPTWTHIDCMPSFSDTLIEFEPA